AVLRLRSVWSAYSVLPKIFSTYFVTEDDMNNFMRVAVLSALLGTGSAWAEGLAKSDQKMLTDLALANMAEIETAKMALQKTQSDRVKSFAQQMVDEHSKGLDEVRKVAAARSV